MGLQQLSVKVNTLGFLFQGIFCLFTDFIPQSDLCRTECMLLVYLLTPNNRLTLSNMRSHVLCNIKIWSLVRKFKCLMQQCRDNQVKYLARGKNAIVDS